MFLQNEKISELENKINVMERKFSEHEIQKLKEKSTMAALEAKLEAANIENMNLKYEVRVLLVCVVLCKCIELSYYAMRKLFYSVLCILSHPYHREIGSILSAHTGKRAPNPVWKI